MTTRHPNHTRLHLVLLASLASSACGDAPGVTTGRENGSAELADETMKPHAAASDKPSSQNSVLQAVAQTEVESQSDAASDAMLIAPGVEQANDVGATDDALPGCEPSVFPRTQNVPTVVERVVTETIEVPVQVEVTPTALLLLDRSLSMRESIDEHGTSRWQAMADLLFAGDEPLLESLQGQVSLGMTHFTARRNSDPSDGAGHCVDLSVPVSDISFETGNFELLRSQQQDAELGYGTPTGEALALVSASLDGIDTEGEKHIVVVTDGEPAHCDDLFDFSSERAVSAVVDAATVARDLGITVHVIGIGPDVSEQHLREMAEAGGGLYRSALDSESMQTAFEEVLREVDVVMVEQTTERIVEDTVMEEQRSCSFQLEFGEHGPAAFMEGGAVRLQGQDLVLDAADGWTIDADDDLQLLGAACDVYLGSETVPQLEIELACPNRYLGVAR